ncbi:MAG: hypothetical protein ACK5X9_07595, partial [Alphaproteobacteria bacterium]
RSKPQSDAIIGSCFLFFEALDSEANGRGFQWLYSWFRSDPHEKRAPRFTRDAPIVATKA